jgi:hypothetical protein
MCHIWGVTKKPLNATLRFRCDPELIAKLSALATADRRELSDYLRIKLEDLANLSTGQTNIPHVTDDVLQRIAHVQELAQRPSLDNLPPLRVARPKSRTHAKK